MEIESLLKKEGKVSRFQKFMGIVSLIIFVDLFTKYLAVKFFAFKTITIIPNFFDLTLVWNRGAAFGFLASAPEFVRKAVLIGASTIAAIAVIVYVYKNGQKLSKLEFFSLALIAGGAIGNLYDRFFIGAVRDFLDFYIGNYHWPAFNIADSAITLGILGFVISEIYLKRKRQ
jgi:signal peptidase II